MTCAHPSTLNPTCTHKCDERGVSCGGVLMIFVYIVHCAVVYESTGMTVYISWKIVGLLWIYGIMD